MGRFLLPGASPAAFLLVCACHAPPLPESAPLPPGITGVGEPTRLALAPDDVLQVNVFGYPELSSPEIGQRIDYEGNLSLPLVGPVHVAGMTVEEARHALTEAVSRAVPDPAVSLGVIRYAPRQLYVLGHVRAGGAFDLANPIPALSALALARGFEFGADRSNVALLRVAEGELIVHTFNAETPGVDALIPVQPGDVLFVRRTGSASFREDVMPYLLSMGPPLNGIAAMIIATDRISD
jgi:polysaccharide export outer membrane protein